MKKFLLTSVISLITLVSTPAFADFQKQVEGTIYTSYGDKPLVAYDGNVVANINAKSSDNVTIAGSTANVTYSLARYNTLNSDTPYLKKQGGWNNRIKYAIEQAIDSVFAKYDVEYIKANTKSIFQEVIDTAQGNADYINPGLSIQQGQIDVKNK